MCGSKASPQQLQRIQAVFDCMAAEAEEGGNSAVRQDALVVAEGNVEGPSDGLGWAEYPGLEELVSDQEEMEKPAPAGHATVGIIIDDDKFDSFFLNDLELQAALHQKPHSAAHHAISQQAKQKQGSKQKQVSKQLTKQKGPIQQSTKQKASIKQRGGTVDLKQTAKNVHSRAYHAAKVKATKDGKSDAEAKDSYSIILHSTLNYNITSNGCR